MSSRNARRSKRQRTRAQALNPSESVNETQEPNSLLHDDSEDDPVGMPAVSPMSAHALNSNSKRPRVRRSMGLVESDDDNIVNEIAMPELVDESSDEDSGSDDDNKETAMPELADESSDEDSGSDFESSNDENKVAESKQRSTVGISIQQYKLNNYNRKHWKVSEKQNGYVFIQHLRYRQISCTIKANRANKALQKLDPERIHLALSMPSQCKCGTSNPCQTKFSFADALQCRIASFGRTDTHSEVDLTDFLASRLLDDNAVISTNPNTNLKYYIRRSNTPGCTDVQTSDNVRVCSTMWAAMFGVCETKMKRIRLLVKNGSTSSYHGNQFKSNTYQKQNICHSFWTHFLKDCQRPTDTIRLFPVNKSFQFIYDEYFVSWFSKMKFPGIPQDERPWIPSFPTFKRARWHSDFADVVRRPKHYHAMCRDCDELRGIRLRGFVNDEHRCVYEVEFKAHARS
jgi:hypothetical protein